MQNTNLADSTGESRPGQPRSRVSKFVAASVAVLGAGAIAVSPVSPVIDDIKAQAQQRAVALTAAADPLAEVLRFFAETATNLQVLQYNASRSSDALEAAMESADLPGELADIIAANASDPLPLINRLLSFQEVYGDDIETVIFGRDADPANGVEAFDGVLDRLQQAIDEFGPTLETILTYDETSPAQGVLNQALFDANRFFVLGILDILRPLAGAPGSGVVALLSIPADFLGGEPTGGFDGALPGVDRLDNVLNLLNEQLITRALVGPFQTAAFQAAKILDDTFAALDVGDVELAMNELVNLPIRVTNAFVNGFTPDFSTCTGNCVPGSGTNEWPSLLDPRTSAPGLIRYALVNLVNDVTTALGGTPPTPVTSVPTPTETPTLLRSEANSVTVNVEPEPAAPAPTDGEQGATDDAAKQVSNTTPGPAAAETKQAIEVEEEATPVKTKTTSTWGKKTQDALEQAGDDLNKAVGNVLKPTKKESAKAEPTTTGGDTTAGGTTDNPDDTGGDDPDNKSESDSSDD